jgi:phage terminase Nu1 subunit (DNA packaging protein)
MIVNRSGLARIVGVSATTIDRRVKEGMPVVEAAQVGDSQQWQFDTAAVIEWLRHRDMPRPRDTRLAKAELRQRNAEAGLVEFDLQQKQKTIIHIEDINEIQAEQFALVSEQLLVIPPELVDALAAEADIGKCRDLLESHVHALLESIHKSDVVVDEDDEDSEE